MPEEDGFHIFSALIGWILKGRSLEEVKLLFYTKKNDESFYFHIVFIFYIKTSNMAIVVMCYVSFSMIVHSSLNLVK